MKIERHIHLNQAVSTNSYIKELLGIKTPLPELSLVDAEFQTGGRGQAGNSWESEKGKNLTFSLLCTPFFIPAHRQFIISQVIALAVRQTLNEYIDDVEVKWPNDIYWHDKKIGGILIECELMGSFIRNCIIGVGLNVNQKEFVSDAPNPVSLAQIIGFSMNREFLLNKIIENFIALYEKAKQGETSEIAKEYMNVLYRREGLYQYEKPDGSRFMAEIAEVKPTGHIVLKKEDGSEEAFEFKEVKFVI